MLSQNPVEVPDNINDRDFKSAVKSITQQREFVSAVVEGIKTPVKLRCNSSDLSVFRQVLVNKEYDFPIDLNPRFIIDAGANIGVSSVYFANRFPSAKILAIEPELSNFEMLLKNTHDWKITPMLAAVWDKKTTLEICPSGFWWSGHWDYTTKESGNGIQKIPGITIQDAINYLKCDIIDILKIDIEGAEKEVFSGNISWLDKVHMIIIELHDRYKDGCSKAFYDAISGKGFTETRRGENVILCRN